MSKFAEIAFARLRSLLCRLRGASIGPKCNFGRGVKIDLPQQIQMGERTTLEDDVWLKLVSSEGSLSIGSYTFIGRGTELDVSERVTIGDHVLIGPGVFVTDHNHNIKAGLRIDEQGCSAAAVDIGNDVWLGTRVVVLPGVTIGDGAVVGAGAVVTKDLPEYSVSVGVPAKVVSTRH